MKVGSAIWWGVRGTAVLSMLSSFCSATLASDPRNYQTAGAVAVGNLDFERAIQIYSKGLEQQLSSKDKTELLRMRAVAAHLANKPDQAEADFNAVVKMIGDTDARAYRERGFFYHRQGRLELSLADYTAGAKLFPDNGDFPNGRGVVLSDQGKFDEAISQFDEAIRLDPTSGVFMLGRAEAYNRSDRPQKALEDYNMALALGHLTRNDTYRLRVGIGATHLKLKNHKAAIESLNAAVELSPSSTTAQRYRGLAFEAAGELDRASHEYEAVLKLKPDDDFAAKRLQKLRAK
jgi:tetratricopeptide (TPR) repeat protein